MSVTEAMRTAERYSAIGMLLLQLLLIPVLAWTAITVAKMSEQIAVLQAQVADVRAGGVYTPEQAMRAHDRIHQTLRDHEIRLRDVERESSRRGGTTSHMPPGR